MQLNKLGWPIALQMGMETASFSLCAIMLGWLGSTALAAHQIMNTITTLCFMIYYGMGAAIAVRVSYFRGQEDLPNLRRSAYAGFHLILLWGIILCTIIFCLRHQLGEWYTDSLEVSRLVALLVIPMLAYQFGDGLQIAFANALRGLADVKPMMYIAFCRLYYPIFTHKLYIRLYPPLGTIGIWMGFPIGLTSAGIAFYLRFRQKTKLTHAQQL